MLIRFRFKYSPSRFSFIFETQIFSPFIVYSPKLTSNRIEYSDRPWYKHKHWPADINGSATLRHTMFKLTHEPMRFVLAHQASTVDLLLMLVHAHKRSGAQKHWPATFINSNSFTTGLRYIVSQQRGGKIAVFESRSVTIRGKMLDRQVICIHISLSL